MLEGVEGCEGTGYSKKESQQNAAKLTLEKLKKDPAFIDGVFAAKTDRTKMEEEPVLNVPDTEEKDDFIISQSEKPARSEQSGIFDNAGHTDYSERSRHSDDTDPSPASDDFDLSDIKGGPMSREEIIAAAEAAAFAEQKEN